MKADTVSNDMWLFRLPILVAIILLAAASRAWAFGQTPATDFSTIPKTLSASEEAEIDEMVLPPLVDWVGDFEGMRQRRLLRILVPYSKTFYRLDHAREQGIDYDYGKAFEKWLNQKYKTPVKNKPWIVVFLPVQRDELLPALVAGKGDIAAGGLTVTEGRRKEVDFTIPFASGVREVLVTRDDSPKVERIEDLAGREIAVRRSSSYYEHLQAINTDFKARGLTTIKLIEVDEWLESEDLLEMVNAGLLPATVVDRYLAEIWQPLYTEIRINDSFYVHEGGDLAWAVRKNSPQLTKVVADFMQRHKVGTEFGNIMVKRHVKDKQRVLNATSEEEMRKFAALVELFKTHAKNYDFDYLMLIAQGFQESMLNQKARSHRGAVGIMQLLPATAADPSIAIQGIETDAGKNIEAGVKYMRLLIDKYLDDPELDSVNRTLFAFAAYNAGPGNLRKFRRLTEKSGQNPNVWFQNVEHAAARIVGRETVTYVSNIYKYYLAYRMVLSIDQQKKSSNPPAT